MLKWAVSRALQRYWRISRGLTMGAQAVVIDEQRRVALVKMTYRDGWCFPGGGVEYGEHARLAVIRELKEEANIDVKSTPELFGLYENFAAFPGDHVALYLVHDWSQPKLPEPNAEIAACEWFSVDDLPPDAVEAVPRRLAEILDGANRSDAW